MMCREELSSQNLLARANTLRVFQKETVHYTILSTRSYEYNTYNGYMWLYYDHTQST